MHDILHESFHILLKMTPILFISLYFFNILNRSTRNYLGRFFNHLGFLLIPVVSLLSALPGCGFTFMFAVLYTEGVIGMGALIASFIACSDEAIYVSISYGRFPIELVGAKLIIASIVGYGISILYREKNYYKNASITANDVCYCFTHNSVIDSIVSVSKQTFKIVAFITVFLIIFQLLVQYLGTATLDKFFLKGNILQPILSAFFGLIPGCATSLTLANFYEQGTLSFGSAVSGLTVVSGEGLLLLFARKVPLSRIITIIGILLLSGISLGITIDYYW